MSYADDCTLEFHSRRDGSWEILSSTGLSRGKLKIKSIASSVPSGDEVLIEAGLDFGLTPYEVDRLCKELDFDGYEIVHASFGEKTLGCYFALRMKTPRTIVGLARAIEGILDEMSRLAPVAPQDFRDGPAELAAELAKLESRQP